jgi:hypothetical protein
VTFDVGADNRPRKCRRICVPLRHGVGRAGDEGHRGGDREQPHDCARMAIGIVEEPRAERWDAAAFLHVPGVGHRHTKTGTATTQVLCCSLERLERSHETRFVVD